MQRELLYNPWIFSISFFFQFIKMSEDSGDEHLERILAQKMAREKQTNMIEIFDGKNSPQNISVYGFLLGIFCGGGLLFSVYGSIPQLGIFLSALTMFHFMEYLSTALFNASTLTLDSYLINHGRQYHAAHAAAFLEFIVEYYFFPHWKTFNYLSCLGLILVIVGQLCRTVAMFSAKHNFSHFIADYKEKDHTLVKHGIYSIMRHPSYFGFFWWALGCQILLSNPICFLGFIVVLQKFFSDRVRYEEITLKRFFGKEWDNYKAQTPTLMPFI
ncbi:Isoprenylcysteine carboxyl methyltransferase family-domain-containing protein [Sporodiniella umbellata]|nr:Isoprenylcysteine carboxyl methyltransferase family-domain-containing protein [Sporodiniella umbellata]